MIVAPHCRTVSIGASGGVGIPSVLSSFHRLLLLLRRTISVCSLSLHHTRGSFFSVTLLLCLALLSIRVLSSLFLLAIGRLTLSAGPLLRFVPSSLSSALRFASPFSVLYSLLYVLRSPSLSPFTGASSSCGENYKLSY